MNAQKIKKEVEYEEAPSGYVTFYNYKEPLMRFKTPEGHGFGFVGALVFDGHSDKVQCHLCGNWYESVASHLHKEHAMSAAQYKSIVGLNKTTALISEKLRAKLIAKGLKRRMKNLVNQKGIKKSLATRRKIAATLRENRDEQKNLHGTCPEQLIERLVSLYQKLGRTPETKEIPFYEALKKTYGGIKQACHIAGIPEFKYRHGKETAWPEARIITKIAEYVDQHGKIPTLTKLFPKATLHQIQRLGGKKKVLKAALSFDGRYRKTSQRFIYTKDELLDFLRNFEKINGRKPSTSDCKRRLLPNASRYLYHWGSWKTALEAANK